MEMIKDLFNAERFAARYKKNGKCRGSERGTILEEIAKLTKHDIKFIAYKTTGLKERDLYSLLSQMKDLVATGRKKNYQHALNSLLFVEKVIPRSHK